MTTSKPPDQRPAPTQPLRALLDHHERKGWHREHVDVAEFCGTAASIALAPIAQAAPIAAQPAAQHIAPAPQTCTTTNVGSECISPGNAQINDAPPFVENFPMYGMFPWIL